MSGISIGNFWWRKTFSICCSGVAACDVVIKKLQLFTGCSTMLNILNTLSIINPYCSFCCPISYDWRRMTVDAHFCGNRNRKTNHRSIKTCLKHFHVTTASNFIHRFVSCYYSKSNRESSDVVLSFYPFD